jgi:H/ACA ribonucleoprotein complex subunit 3
MNIAFVFDAKRRGINDGVKLPRLRGQLLDSTCFFTEKRCWFLVCLKDQGKLIRHCVVIQSNGLVEANFEASDDEEIDWLSSIRGKCVAGNFMLAATDEGIVKIDVKNNQIFKTKNFPDTEPFVDSSNHLFLSQEGLYVVGQRNIRLLKIS